MELAWYGYVMFFAVCICFVYIRRASTREGLVSSLGKRRYTLKELACALQAIKRHLGKEGDAVFLIDVKSVAWISDTANIVCTAFNKTKLSTKVYKAEVTSGKVITIIDNMVQFNEKFVESKAFGTPIGLHDSESLDQVPFMTSDIANLSRYTFTKSSLNEMSLPDDNVAKALALYTSLKNKKHHDNASTALALYTRLKNGKHNDDDDDVQKQLLNIISNPEMRKYVVINAMRNK